MTGSKHQKSTTEGRAAWRLARAQHGVVTSAQLKALGFTGHAIDHRVATGRLHPVHRGVYAVGRRELNRHGRWMAAVRGCGSGAVLSHGSAAALWGFGFERRGTIDVTVPFSHPRRRSGVLVHRRPKLQGRDVTVRDGIPVTTVVRTLIDLATRLASGALERAVNEADRLDLIDPEALLAALASYPGQHGVGPLKAMLGERTFRLTDSELERRFLPLAARAGLPAPLTHQRLNGFEVDFYWPDLRLVVETDGLRYHRTPAQQARDRVRDQTHTAAGLTPLRFTHAQVAFEPRRVEAVLRSVAGRADRPGELVDLESIAPERAAAGP
jgi:very-short-patch-repair endonuclease